MNNIFNIQRFLQYLKKHTIEHGKIYLLSIGVMWGILLLAFIFNSLWNTPHYTPVSTQTEIFFFCGVGGGSVFTSLIFTSFGDKKQAIPTLLLPVSNFEKYLVAWLYSYLVFQIIFVCSFYFIDWSFMGMFAPKYKPYNELFNITKGTDWQMLFTVYAVLHAFTFWGAIYFNKLHFIKTAVVFFIYFMVFNVISKVFISSITNGVVRQDVLRSRAVIMQQGDWDITPNNNLINLGFYAIAVVVLLLWVSAFFRLKEKQV
ncbi:MAG: hypothetical protein JWR50_3269 [Mucilaginibacter sp.]|nr:hypothetical protein [Mucilaginibacter sp.]